MSHAGYTVQVFMSRSTIEIASTALDDTISVWSSRPHLWKEGLTFESTVGFDSEVL